MLSNALKVPGFDSSLACRKHCKHCFDCGKPPAPHINHYVGHGYRICCWCFYFWLTSETWSEVTTEYHRRTGIQSNGMLCLHCVRKRLGRDMVPKDFDNRQCGFFDEKQESLKAYIKRMVKYANSQENTSLVL